MKTSRNAPCPCGSGKKYKRCCLSREGSPIRLATAVTQSQSPSICALIPEEPDLDELSNSVVDLINRNRLDEAEKACGRLLAEFPDCVDGIERLVAVHKARGNFLRAADYARQTVAFMREHEEDFDPELIKNFETQERDLRQRAAEPSPAPYSSPGAGSESGEA